MARFTRELAFEERHAHDFLGNAPELLEERHAWFIEEGVPRAAGGCVCADCGKPYADHPSVVGALWTTELCDGRLVKL